MLWFRLLAATALASLGWGAVILAISEGSPSFDHLDAVLEIVVGSVVLAAVPMLPVVALLDVLFGYGTPIGFGIVGWMVDQGFHPLMTYFMSLPGVFATAVFIGWRVATGRWPSSWRMTLALGLFSAIAMVAILHLLE
ncbi:MAG: hypothetical protein AAFQ81_11085 [Pseudomonadota bacterium]